MREIKFRAWQPHTSLHRKPGMYVVEELVWYEKPDEDGNTGEVFFFGKEQPSSEYIEDVRLMQYTGFKDKKGTEIYEGDYVKSPTYFGFIDFRNGCFKLIDNERGEQLWIPDPDKLTVLGNIYEAADLLNDDTATSEPQTPARAEEDL